MGINYKGDIMKQKGYLYITKIEESLSRLCWNFISFLDDLLNLGKITYEEYEELSRTKKDFIKKTSSHK